MQLKVVLSAVALCLALVIGCSNVDPLIGQAGGANTAPDTPRGPNPGDGAVNSLLSTGLKWTGGDKDGDSVQYYLYFGTSATNMPLVATPKNGLFDSLNDLDFATTYYWKIVANDGRATTEGPVWSFTTKSAPLAVAGWTLFDISNSGIIDNNITALAFDDVVTHKLFIGTRYQGMAIFNGVDQWDNDISQPGLSLPGYAITGLAFDINKMLWIGTWGGGLVRWNRNRIDSAMVYDTVASVRSQHMTYDTVLNVIDTIFANNVFNPQVKDNLIASLQKSQNGDTLFVGTKNGGNFLLKPQTNSTTFYSSANSLVSRYLPKNTKWSFLNEPSKNQFWIGSETGVIFYDTLRVDTTPKIGSPARDTTYKIIRSITMANPALAVYQNKKITVYRSDTNRTASYDTTYQIDTATTPSNIFVRYDTLLIADTLICSDVESVFVSSIDTSYLIDTIITPNQVVLSYDTLNRLDTLIGEFIDTTFDTSYSNAYGYVVDSSNISIRLQDTVQMFFGQRLKSRIDSTPFFFRDTITNRIKIVKITIDSVNAAFKADTLIYADTTILISQIQVTGNDTTYSFKPNIEGRTDSQGRIKDSTFLRLKLNGSTTFFGKALTAKGVLTFRDTAFNRLKIVNIQVDSLNQDFKTDTLIFVDTSISIDSAAYSGFDTTYVIKQNIKTTLNITSIVQTAAGVVDSVWDVVRYAIPELPSNVITAMIDDGRAKWIGTANGLVRYFNGTWKTFTIANSGLPSNRIQSLALDASKRLWIGTDAGLVRFDNP